MKLVIAGGGTGGHLFPGIAIAEEFLQLSSSHQVLFVGTKRGIEFKAVPKAGYQLQCIEVTGIKNTGALSKIKSLFLLPKSLFKSMQILSKFETDVVLGVGGYASGPLLLAAFLLRKRTAICEQNSVPGLTNTILSKLVRHIFTSFESSEVYFPKSKVLLLGNPVRKQFLDGLKEKSLEVESGRIFVFGGSQGARPLNQKMPQLLSKLQAKLGKSLKLKIIHQCGKGNAATVKELYLSQETKLDVEVVDFIDDMMEQYLKAEMVICRAGATSCAEISVMGVAAAFVPFPQASDDHQSKNAEHFVAKGAAYLFQQDKLDGLEYVEILNNSLLNPELLMQMRERMRELAFPEAGLNIAKILHDRNI